MSDFFEIDFLPVGTTTSGDAIPIRYQQNGTSRIHIVDGGYQDTGKEIISHVNKYYGNPSFIDAVVVTHQDGDHTGGLRTVLEELEVGELWMLRPWLYADELIERFSRFTNVENLRRRLKEVYSNLAALEEIAEEKGIPIYEPFQGAKIGEFIVLAPSKARYFDLIESSEKTPEAVERDAMTMIAEFLKSTISKVIALWGDESFSSEETSVENDMSVIQFAYLSEKRILLTGDAGRGGLTEAADFFESMGGELPGIDRFQIPHHGSRRNVSTEILDRWLGERIPAPLQQGLEAFSGLLSAAKDDEDHPRNCVVRAICHRGGKVVYTKGTGLCSGRNNPKREGWSTAKPMPYPEDQESD